MLAIIDTWSHLYKNNHGSKNTNCLLPSWGVYTWMRHGLAYPGLPQGSMLTPPLFDWLITYLLSGFWHWRKARNDDRKMAEIQVEIQSRIRLQYMFEIHGFRLFSTKFIPRPQDQFRPSETLNKKTWIKFTESFTAPKTFGRNNEMW